MANYIYTPHEHIQTTPATIWTITHGFSRKVNIAVFDTLGKRIYAVVEQPGANPNQATVKFFEKGVAVAVAGRAIAN